MENGSPAERALTDAIAHARQEAEGHQKRYVVVEEGVARYAVWALDRYKQLQVPHPIVATALPDGELRR